MTAFGPRSIPARRFPGGSGTPRSAAWAVLLGLLVSSAPAWAGSFRVRVNDGRTGLPLTGAFVQVGTSPGDPFPSNWGWTDAGGAIQFTADALQGPQTVTAGSSGYALLTVVGAPADSVSLLLHPEVALSSLPPPKAEVGGGVTGITVQNNDGNLDLGMVYPAVRLSDLLTGRSLPFEVPPDTVNFPLVGQTVIPGNVVLPTQVELLLLTYSKTHYHLFVPEPATYDFVVVAGRMPLSALASAGLPMNQLTMRQAGARRNAAVAGNATLDMTSNLTLARTLTVSVPEAPNGSKVFAAAVGDLPSAVGARSIFFDGKSALRDTLGAFRLSGMNPAGSLSDLTPYIAGYYGDSSAANTYQAGRVDRSSLVLPATRSLSGFFLLPEMGQSGDSYQWTDVARPGFTPEPTWGVATFRIDAITPGDSTVVPRTVWEVWAPAANLALRLPALAPGAPGGLPDPSLTPEPDRLLWDEWLCDASGSFQAVLTDAFSTLTRWSRRTVEIQPVAVVEEVALGTISGRVLRFKLIPNPGSKTRTVSWDRAPQAGQTASWSIWDPAGRKLASGTFTTSGQTREAGAVTDTGRLQTGIYWVKIKLGDRSGSQPFLVTR